MTLLRSDERRVELLVHQRRLGAHRRRAHAHAAGVHTAVAHLAVLLRERAGIAAACVYAVAAAPSVDHIAAPDLAAVHAVRDATRTEAGAVVQAADHDAAQGVDADYALVQHTVLGRDLALETIHRLAAAHWVFAAVAQSGGPRAAAHLLIADVHLYMEKFNGKKKRNNEDKA